MWLAQGSASESTIALITRSWRPLHQCRQDYFSRHYPTHPPTGAGVPASSRRGPGKPSRRAGHLLSRCELLDEIEKRGLIIVLSAARKPQRRFRQRRQDLLARRLQYACAPPRARSARPPNRRSRGSDTALPDRHRNRGRSDTDLERSSAQFARVGYQFGVAMMT
jgi:hypothetical protein